MQRIYLDNGATTFPKPAAVPAAMSDFITNSGVNINRGSYAPAYDTEEKVFMTRLWLKELFGGSDVKNVRMSSLRYAELFKRKGEQKDFFVHRFKTVQFKNPFFVFCGLSGYGRTGFCAKLKQQGQIDRQAYIDVHLHS